MARTPAAWSRLVIQAGEDEVSRISQTAAAYRGHSSASSMRHGDAARMAFAWSCSLAQPGRQPKRQAYAVAISRAKPTTLRQSGRLAVTSKSMTPSSSGPAGSIAATSKPRRPSVSAISLDRRL